MLRVNGSIQHEIIKLLMMGVIGLLTHVVTFLRQEMNMAALASHSKKEERSAGNHRLKYPLFRRAKCRGHALEVPARSRDPADQEGHGAGASHLVSMGYP